MIVGLAVHAEVVSGRRYGGAMTVRPFAPTDADAVRSLVARARETDGVAPLNEESTLALARAARETGDSANQILVATSDAAVIGVAVDPSGEGEGVDLVVDPSVRRRGHGRSLIDAMRAETPGAGFWAHGNLPAAQAVAASAHLTMVRDLWRMERPVTEGEHFDTALPAGFVARAFDGSDQQAEAWLTVNAEAFVHHPEQGRMTMADFKARAAEDWFEPKGLVLVWDETVTPARLAASHWTKREPGSSVGEVYVVAVAPAYQGRGLARPLTALGLKHLADVGVTTIDLYVEGDNEPAKATYARAGFHQAGQDSMYVADTSTGLTR